MSESQNGRCHGCRNPQPLERAEIAAFDIEVGANGQEPIRILRKRAQKLGALPGREGLRRGVSRSAKEMQGTVAQFFCAVVGAIGALKLDIDVFLLEKSELNRRNGDEIGR